jgi:mannose-6-phosphate isomerase-like protein (cupin superfamily)
MMYLLKVSERPAEVGLSRKGKRMKVADLAETQGRVYPARRRTQNVVGGSSPIQAETFSLGYVTLDAGGGQVPWHNQEQEEVYFVLDGTAEMCLGDERQTLTSGQAVYIPSGVFHQLTNVDDKPLRMLYCYGPAGDVAHWRQELEGTLPKAGVDAPALPPGAHPQHTDPPADSPR